MDTHAAGREILREGIDALLQGGGGHIEAVAMGGIEMLPGKNIDALFQTAVKVIVQDAVRLAGQNIVVAKALACGELVEKLPGIPQGPDIEDADVRLRDGKKEILEGAVQLRAQIPEYHKLLLSALRQLPR